MKNTLSDFISLIFPNICFACDQLLVKGEKCICTFCRYKLPYTNYHLEPENPLVKYFWGRVKIEAAASIYFFNKGGKVQKLLHRLKYEGKKEIGFFLGETYGYQLKSTQPFSETDLIIPVPLHQHKKVKRGYNQSECFAEGLSNSMGILFDYNILQKNFDTDTQTRKSRYKRWENVSEKFKLTSADKLKGKHILLVDDVITTGSTVEACAQKLLEIQDVRISVATIACA